MCGCLEICFQDILENSINSLNCLSNKYSLHSRTALFLESKANSLKEPMYVKDFKCAAPSLQLMVKKVLPKYGLSSPHTHTSQQDLARPYLRIWINRIEP